MLPKQVWLCCQLYRGQGGRWIPRPKCRGAEEEICIQMPPDEGKRNRKHLSGERHQLSQGVQHICHWWQRRLCKHLGRLQQKATLPVPQVSWREFKILSIVWILFNNQVSNLHCFLGICWRWIRVSHSIFLHVWAGEVPSNNGFHLNPYQFRTTPLRLSQRTPCSSDLSQTRRRGPSEPSSVEWYPSRFWMTCLASNLVKKNALNQTSPALSHYLLVRLCCI